MRHTTIKIERPEGQIETLDISEKFPRGLTDGMFETIKEATKNAGKGECLSYETKEEEISPEELAEIKAHDDKARWFEKHGFNGNDIN